MKNSIIFILVMWIFFISTVSFTNKNYLKNQSTLDKFLVDSLIAENYNHVLITNSLQCLRQEVDSLKQLVANTNVAWLAIYDNLVDDNRYEWTVGLTNQEIDSIVSER